jgi:hypothetical protein
MITLWLIGIYLTKQVCDYMFPAEMTKVYLKTSLYGLRCFSFICLACDKVYNGYRDFIMDHEKKEDIVILCIVNGKVVSELTGPDLQLFQTFIEQCDLVLYKERIKSNDKYKYQLTRLDKYSSLENLPNPSTVHFVDITVNINGQKYTLDFGINDFYIEDNILCDQKFLQWYLNTFFNVDLVDNYTCTIMDTDINFITLDKNSHIVIKKDAYEVGANAVGANAVGANAVGANAVGANAVGANAVGANAVGANAVGANAVGANAVG